MNLNGNAHLFSWMRWTRTAAPGGTSLSFAYFSFVLRPRGGLGRTKAVNLSIGFVLLSLQFRTFLCGWVSSVTGIRGRALVLLQRLTEFKSRLRSLQLP